MSCVAHSASLQQRLWILRHQHVQRGTFNRVAMALLCPEPNHCETRLIHSHITVYILCSDFFTGIIRLSDRAVKGSIPIY